MPKNRWTLAGARRSPCSRRREEADLSQILKNPPPHVGGYNLTSLACVLLLLWCSVANLPAATSERFTVKGYGAREGLPQSSVLAVTQARDGYLWLGTGAGLARFDGIRCTPFDDGRSAGLDGSPVFKLFEDSQTNLWIGTESAGVVLVKNGKVTRLNIGGGSLEGRLVAACEDSTGAVWLSMANGQLYRYRSGKPEVVHVNNCQGLIADDSGLIWIATETGRQEGGSVVMLYALGPFTATSGPGLPVTYELPAGKLDYLLASPRGGYWRLNGRIQKWRRDHLERDLGPYPWDPTKKISAVCEDAQGNLAVGTYGDGVYWFGAEGKFKSLSGELSHNYIQSLAADREGCLWVGTDGGGLKRVRRNPFDVLDEGLTIQSACEDGQGGLWFGINGAGVGYWRNGALKMFQGGEGLASPYARYVRAALVDREQNVWAGTDGEGLFQLQEGVFKRPPGADALDRHISAVFQDHRGTLWVGTQAGLARREENSWKTIGLSDGLSANAIQALADDSEGNLWVGTAGGLDCLRDGHVTTTNALSGESIASLYADEDGVLWVGTSAGLARFQNGKWTRYSKNEGLITRRVGYLVEDAQGYLWLGSTAGLIRARKKELNDFAHGMTNPIPWRVYGEQDGLPTSECTSGSQPAACRTREGRLWFPTTRGLISLDPAQLNFNTNQPPVMIESVLVEDQPQTTNSLRTAPIQAVTIPAGKERLEIHYTSLNLAAADRARFKYRLEPFNYSPQGKDPAWTSVGEIRVAYYAKVPQGHYRFHVQACNEDGVWNEPGAALELTVLPPFWSTWWFRTLSAVVLLAVIIGSVHYASTQKLERQLESLRQQEAVEKERARIARDLHDQLGANLTQVALLGELAEEDKNSPPDVEAHAQQICQTALETTRALDEIVWTVNPSNDTLDGLVNYICKYAQDYLAVAGLRYRLDVPSQLPGTPISPELRHNIFLASKEAITNVVRHAKATAASIRLHLEPNRFTLEIEDNGRGVAGLDQSAAQTRNGLRNMRKRMEDVGGTFSIEPAASGGAVVRLSAPLGNDSLH